MFPNHFAAWLYSCHVTWSIKHVQVIQAEGTIYMVLEYGDIDLARLLAKHEQDRRDSAGKDVLDENFIRLYWQQMLQVCLLPTLSASLCLHRSLSGLMHSMAYAKA